jgi:hypothetical protein
LIQNLAGNTTVMLGVAVMMAFASILVGSTLEAPPSADDNRIFFVIGTGLSAVVLFLIAEVWTGIF